MKPKMATVEVGNQRLLYLATILDSIPETATNKVGNPAYNQYEFYHACDAPACAIGYWAAANKKRWCHRYGHPRLRRLMGKFCEGFDYLDSACYEFALTREEAESIFSQHGCDYAEHDAKKAAQFIRNFVANRPLPA